jgi:hypothetical protein
MTIADYLAAQMHEALGPVNKWYCSQHYGREITDPETLVRYYIKNGGARHFAQGNLPESYPPAYAASSAASAAQAHEPAMTAVA